MNPDDEKVCKPNKNFKKKIDYTIFSLLVQYRTIQQLPER